MPGFELLLDGVDDYARATTVFPDTTIAQSFTVEAWIYPTAADDVVSYILKDDEVLVGFEVGDIEWPFWVAFSLSGIFFECPLMQKSPYPV